MNVALRFSNLIFDLDGTLVDSSAGIAASIRYAVAETFPSLVVPSIDRFIGPPIAKMFAQMWPHFAPAELDALVAAFREHYDTHGSAESRLYPRVCETLQVLRELEATMFVLTNKPLRATQNILKQTAVADFFEEIISPDAVDPAFASKTAGAEYLRARHLLEGARTAVIGDGQDDAAAAGACGFTFIFARYGYGAAANEYASAAVASLDSFDEVVPLLKCV